MLTTDEEPAVETEVTAPAVEAAATAPAAETEVTAPAVEAAVTAPAAETEVDKQPCSREL